MLLLSGNAEREPVYRESIESRRERARRTWKRRLVVGTIIGVFFTLAMPICFSFVPYEETRHTVVGNAVGEFDIIEVHYRRVGDSSREFLMSFGFSGENVTANSIEHWSRFYGKEYLFYVIVCRNFMEESVKVFGCTAIDSVILSLENVTIHLYFDVLHTKITVLLYSVMGELLVTLVATFSGLSVLYLVYRYENIPWMVLV